MVILALETATRAGSVAIWQDGVSAAAAGDASRTHGERLPGELTRWAETHGRSIADVDLFAVVSGPGSFTGLRVGIAAIQGLALSGGRLVVAVPTLDALVEAWTSSPSPDADASIVVPCLDGQRGEVFIAAYDHGVVDADGHAATLIEPAALRAADASALLAERAGTRATVIVGDGGRRFADVFTSALPQVRIVDASMTLAEAAVRIAAAHPDRATAPHAIRPIYLRRPDAVIARERAGISPAPAPRFTVRRLEGDADLGAVEALQRRTFTNPWGAEAIRWELEHTDVARLYVLDAPDGALIAYCACWMVFDELHLNSVAVDERWRRHGAARTLLVHVFAEAAAAGARSATLEVRRSNTAALALYEGLGFKVEAVRRDYYQDPREDALILWNRAIAGA
jgi:tRNA threonylcarbamoyl adenosine modification protein YeaZ/ribosomal-protein-alanine acetyltransferase